MSASVGAPATFKQPSRKGKKAWRKNVDVTEVNEGLDQLRDEVIAGGVVAEKSNEQLFQLDIIGDRGIARKLAKQKKMLKSDEILTARSAVPAVSSRKRLHDVGVTDGVVPVKKAKKDWVSHKDLQRMKRIAYGAGEAAVAKKNKAGDELHDPWGEPEVVVKDPRLTFLEEQQAIKEPVTLKHAPVALTVSGRPMPAVKLPEPGISYNPHFGEWEDLKRRKGEEEVIVERRRLAVQQAEKERLERLAIEDAQEYAKELLEAERGDNEEEEEEEEDENADAETKEKYLKKRAERKTRVQRNREKRRKEAEKQLEEAQLKKKQRVQLEMLKQIKAEVEVEEAAKVEALAKEAEAAGDTKEAEKIRRRRFGRNHLPEAPLELQFEEELADSLRRLKPEGNLLKERFRSLMERGILETRVMPVVQRKRKVTEVEKWSYKDFK
ncbi:ribosome biogenesis protein Nop53/GLTSCR2 [Peziza echinospora]|nr:ribosome biogenesis protein Nop53/GLTSCR2 [Peziza echinospora]